MPLKPVVIEVDIPQMLKHNKSPRPQSSGAKRGVKLFVSFVSFVMISSALLFTALGIKHNSTSLSKDATQSTNQLQPGGVSQNIAMSSSNKKTNSTPVISLTASSASVEQGATVELKWSVTNSPTSCTASGDWQGSKSEKGGSEKTPTLSKIQSYIFTLTCKGPTGNNSTSIAVNVSPKGSVGTVAKTNQPTVTISSNPISVSVGGSATLTWSATNNPSSCTASGSWSGSRGANGSASTGALTVAKVYTYTLTCSNANGSGSASATITVSASGNTITAKPTVSIVASPTAVSVGGSATLTWSATNNPSSCTASGSWSGSRGANGSASTGALTVAKTYVFSITCSNKLGSASASASVNAVPRPTVALSVSPNSITSGGRVTATWSTTGSPTSCVAGGSGWSGSKTPSGGSQAITLSSAGQYTFSLLCSNLAAASSPMQTVSVIAVTYCGGRGPCYSTADLNSHNTYANCWGYNVSAADPSNRAVYNIGSFNGAWHIPATGKNLLPSDPAKNALCGAYNFYPYISGTSLSGVGGHGHKASTLQNTNATMNAYLVGYYDPNKP